MSNNKMKKCSECGVSVKISNYDKHLRNVHNLSPNGGKDYNSRDMDIINNRRKFDFKIVIIAVICIVIIAAFGILYYPSSSDENENEDINPVSDNNENIKEITISAKRFEFSPANIELNQGQKTRINIINTDVTHGIVIPDFSVSGNSEVVFTPDAAGTFPFYCGNYCGSGHHGMAGTIIVK
jgi:cytochrome c oxidase subunit 2